MRLLEILQFLREILAFLKEVGPELSELIDLLRSLIPKSDQQKQAVRAALREAIATLRDA